MTVKKKWPTRSEWKQLCQDDKSGAELLAGKKLSEETAADLMRPDKHKAFICPKDPYEWPGMEDEQIQNMKDKFEQIKVVLDRTDVMTEAAEKIFKGVTSELEEHRTEDYRIFKYCLRPKKRPVKPIDFDITETCKGVCLCIPMPFTQTITRKGTTIIHSEETIEVWWPIMFASFK